MSYKIPREPSKYQCSKKAFVVSPNPGADNEYCIFEGVIAQVDYSGFYQYKLIDKNRNMIHNTDPQRVYNANDWFKEETLFKKKEEAEEYIKGLISQKVAKLRADINKVKQFKIVMK